MIQRPACAAVTMTLGLVALLLGASLLMLRDGGWPWHASISGPVGTGTGSATAEIIDDDGKAYRFTGSPTDAQRWLADKQDELKNAHGIPTKIAVGQVLQPVGLTLVLLGLAQLFWGFARVRSAQSVSSLP